MAALGAYIGHLLAEITNARVQADLESVRIAQLYASHPLLKHMPIPRFRLPSVTLDFPVAVDKIDDSVDATPPADVYAIRKTIANVVESILAQHNLERFVPGILNRATPGMEEVLKSFGAADSRNAVALSQASAQTVDLVLAAVRAEVRDGMELQLQVEPAIRQRIAAEFSKLQAAPPSVLVVVNTSQLKELGPTQNLTRFQMTISEEGFEWTQTNPSDASSQKLVPE